MITMGWSSPCRIPSKSSKTHPGILPFFACAGQEVAGDRIGREFVNHQLQDCCKAHSGILPFPHALNRALQVTTLGKSSNCRNTSKRSTAHTGFQPIPRVPSKAASS